MPSSHTRSHRCNSSPQARCCASLLGETRFSLTKAQRSVEAVDTGVFSMETHPVFSLTAFTEPYGSSYPNLRTSHFPSPRLPHQEMHALVPGPGSSGVFQRHRPGEIGGEAAPTLELEAHAGARQAEVINLAGQWLLYARHAAIDESQQSEFLDLPEEIIGVVGREHFQLPRYAVVAQRIDFIVATHGIDAADDGLLVIDEGLRRDLPACSPGRAPALAQAVGMRKIPSQKQVIGVGLETLVGEFRFAPDQAAHMKVHRQAELGRAPLPQPGAVPASGERHISDRRIEAAAIPEIDRLPKILVIHSQGCGME